MTEQMKNRNSKMALITGASSGIGREFARIFSKNGYDIILIARRKERLQELANNMKEEFGTKSIIIPKDLSKLEAAKQIYDNLKEQNVNVDVLINNAGFDVYGNFHETDYNEELNMVKVNLIAPTYLTKLFLKDMVKRGEGKILNLGSTGSFIAAPLNSIYCATKAYILSMSLSIGEEVKDKGVIVTCLCPGPTKTEFHASADMEDIKIMEGHVMKARKVAEIGYNGLMKGKRVVIPGFRNKLQAFASRLLPRKKIPQVAKSYMEKQNN